MFNQGNELPCKGFILGVPFVVFRKWVLQKQVDELLESKMGK
jgi:hypothetical protein